MEFNKQELTDLINALDHAKEDIALSFPEESDFVQRIEDLLSRLHKELV